MGDAEPLTALPVLGSRNLTAAYHAIRAFAIAESCGVGGKNGALGPAERAFRKDVADDVATGSW